jgi:hypothetical protein
MVDGREISLNCLYIDTYCRSLHRMSGWVLTSHRRHRTPFTQKNAGTAWISLPPCIHRFPGHQKYRLLRSLELTVCRRSCTNCCIPSELLSSSG